MATKVEILRQKAQDAAAAFSAEMAKYGDDNLPTEADAAHVDELRGAMTGAMKELRGVEEFLKDKNTWNQQEELMRVRPARPPLEREAELTRQPAERRSIGQRFVEMDAYNDWLRAVAPNGVVNEASGFRIGTSPSLRFDGYRDIQRNAALLTGTSDTSGGAFVTPTYYPDLTELGRRPLTIRSIVTNLQTNSDTVEFVRITTETNNAAPVVEATASSGGSGVKPESSLAFERVSTSVKTIAHWIPATKRALSDAAQLRGLIDAFLRYGLDEELEDQIANGDGVGENFTGILNTANTQAQAWVTNILTTTRQAKRKVRTVGRRIPTAYILNPEDWETIDLLQDNEARYYGGGPFAVMAPRLWGLPVIESEAIPVGTGLVGDFSVCVLWDREQSSVSVSDSHSDFFIRNLVAILAELRAAFGILKPNAIVEIDLTA